MTRDEAFLQAILAEPDDDAHRLVYADWLDDHGRGDRARLIRLQCEYARLEGADDVPERRAAVAAEVVALVRTHKTAWVDELPDCAGVYWKAAPNDDSPGGVFERGFVNQIFTESPAALLSGGDQAFAVAPVQRLYLGWLGPRAVRKFGAWPYLARLRTFQTLGADDKAVAELARTPALASLRQLKLSSCRITAVGARALAESPHFGELRLVDVRNNPLGVEGRRVLRDQFGDRPGRLLLD